MTAIRQADAADAGDVGGLALLLWLDTRDEEPTGPSLDAFTAELDRWWTRHRDTHRAFVAALPSGREGGAEIIGMAWVALVDRIPRPGATSRMSADIQTVFVMPDHRGRGVGSELVEAAAAHATRLGAIRVTVHSGSRAVPVYERLGFASSRQLLQRPPG
ncbi:hypothetical protein GCM10011575_26030 [Microlunatus endophyticus]|uniref:N-acetyltransferase domain-containing protein n=1 Tax=Microlunatus endophyticus TaxID=1716077 RepID=A0A917SBN8_9ACTN|nr:GNAT family N-acetyltransferase [Microlunatus endophyticus]GGL66292.1 hypothetical protein GCM10011575_26030 [Microlunatus endophyticus]